MACDRCADEGGRSAAARPRRRCPAFSSTATSSPAARMRHGASKPRRAGADDDRVRASATEPSAGGWSLSSPDLVGDLDREPQLGPLLFLGEDVAFLGRGKAALRRQRELIQRREFGGLLQPALDVVLFLQLAGLGGDDADHHDLVALRQIAQRLEAAGAVGIIFQEIAVVIGAGQHGLGHRLVAAGRNPGRAEIAAADMRRDHHVGRPLGDRVVDDAGVDFLQAVGIVAALARLLQFILRAEIGPYRVVELQIAAAGVVERLHRLAVGLAEIRDRTLRDRDRPSCEIDLRPPRKCSTAGDGIVIFGRDMGDVACFFRNLKWSSIGWSSGKSSLPITRMASCRVCTPANWMPSVGVKQLAAGQMAEKVEMPPRAAELAVGRELQAGRGLLVHDLLDLHVLGLAQIVGRNLALLQFGARLLDARRPQQAADLIGAERGFGSLHGLHSRI